MANEREVLGLLVSEWSSLGTVGAVIVSLAIGLVGYRHSRKIEASLRDERSRSQAAKVTAWQIGSDLDQEGVALAILNNSDMPIYNGRVPELTIFNTSTGEDDPLEFSVMPPGKTWTARLGHQFGDISETWELFFTDASGLDWRRAADGTLTLVPNRPLLLREALPGPNSTRPWAR